MFEPIKIMKTKKGRMVMLYAICDGDEPGGTHMASFFHEDKADFVLNAIKEATGIETVDLDKEVKKSTKKKKPVKKMKKK